jgi:hypothetical protein
MHSTGESDSLVSNYRSYDPEIHSTSTARSSQSSKAPSLRDPTQSDFSQLQNVKVKINEVKIELQHGIDKAIDRGEKLEILEIKAEELEENAVKFNRRAKRLKCKFCLENARMVGCILLLIAIIIAVIIVIVKSKN